jgi:lipoic acid synthetase
MEEEQKDIQMRKRTLPSWIRAPLPHGENYTKVKNLVKENNLHTICSSGNCPNKGECWSAGTASFMILGEICTRNCRFCNVQNAIPYAVDWKEPINLANAIKLMGVKHCVITSVDRDDLKDGGAAFWALTIQTVKRINPGITLETLIPDFNGRLELIQKIIDAGPEVISHNLETVRRLTPMIRNAARYDRSISVIEYISQSKTISKSGIMLGLGEKESEVLETMDDLQRIRCKVLTIGQYLRPTPHHASVHEYIKPAQFEFYRVEGLKRGFVHVESSPMVRSSYHAERHVKV